MKQQAPPLMQDIPCIDLLETSLISKTNLEIWLAERKRAKVIWKFIGVNALKASIIMALLFTWTTLMSPYVGSEETVYVPALDPVVEPKQKAWIFRAKDVVVGKVVDTAVGAKNKVASGAKAVGQKIKDVGILDKRILKAKAETKHWKKQAKYWQAQYEAQRDADAVINESKGERWSCSEVEAKAAGWRAPRG